MKPHRLLQVGEQLKRGLSEIFSLNREEFGSYLLTVTEVRLPRDLRSARVWVSVYGENEKRQEAIRLLSRLSGRIRHLLAGRVNLKRVPELNFILDETLDTAERIDFLLKKSGIQDNREVEENNLNEYQSGTDS